MMLFDSGCNEVPGGGGGVVRDLDRWVVGQVCWWLVQDVGLCEGNCVGVW